MDDYTTKLVQRAESLYDLTTVDEIWKQQASVQ